MKGQWGVRQWRGCGQWGSEGAVGSGAVKGGEGAPAWFSFTTSPMRCPTKANVNTRKRSFLSSAPSKMTLAAHLKTSLLAGRPGPSAWLDPPAGPLATAVTGPVRPSRLSREGQSAGGSSRGFSTDL